MAFVLATVNTTNGLENQAAQALLSLKRFATLTPPVSETDMRNEVETGQPVGFMSDAGWLAFVGVLSSLSLDESSLTNAERSIVNTLRAVVSPPPNQSCCGAVIPANSDGFSSIAGYPRTGSATWEHEIELTNITANYDCDISTIEVTLTPIGLAPAVTSANPVILTFKSCVVSGGNTNALFNSLWTTFAADPTGESYDVDLEYKDADGLTIATYTAAYTLNL